MYTDLQQQKNVCNRVAMIQIKFVNKMPDKNSRKHSILGEK